MKYFFLFLISFNVLVWATPTPLENTIIETLVESNILVDHSKNPKKYEQNAKISRAETIGMALKMAKISLDEKYFCRNYFRDVQYDGKNNWVCRAVEKAADLNIISRTNDFAHPKKNITRIEALAIIMKAGKIPYEKNVDRTNYPKDMAQWMVDIIDGAFRYRIITSVENFSPHKIATRMDVFGMIYNAKFAGKYQSEFNFNTDELSLASAPDESQNMSISLPLTSTKPTNTTPGDIVISLPLNKGSLQKKIVSPPISTPPSSPKTRAIDFLVTHPETIMVDEPFDIVVSAIDTTGAKVEDFFGTIYFRGKLNTSSEILVESWRRYTFQKEDTGKKLLSGLYTFKKAGVYEITLMAQLHTLIEKRIIVTVKDASIIEITPPSLPLKPTPPPATPLVTTPPIPTTTTPAPVLQYRFRDASTPPTSHRSYTIEVTPEQVKFTIDAYNNILSTHLITLEKTKYDAFKKSIGDLKLKTHSMTTSAICRPSIGGGIDTITLESQENKIVAEYSDDCDVREEFLEAIELFQSLVPELQKKIDATKTL